MRWISRLSVLFAVAVLSSACGATPPATLPPSTSAAPADETPAAGDVKTTWITSDLTDVRTGQLFKISDFKNKVVLVEAMAVWCSNCKSQQGEVKKLHAALGPREDFVSVGLGIDPNESADQLKSYVDKNGFNWAYALSPSAVSREMARLYGAQFLNPTAVPMLVIDRDGNAHPLPFGVKGVEMLQEALKPYLK
jgi:hypothetical protein